MELAQVSDPFLISRIASGDAAALRELYRRHEQFLYSFAYHLVGSEERAATVLAKVFARLWRRGLPRQTDLVSWLLSLVHQEGLSLGWQGGPAAEPAPRFTSAEAASLAEVVVPALNELPEAERQALEQLYFRGADLPAVAPLLGVAADAVAERLEAPLEHLRDKWAIGVEAEVHAAEPLILYALGRLEGEALHSLLSHLRHCSACRGRASDYRAVVELLPYSVLPLTVPPSVAETALSFLPQGPPGALRPWQRLNWTQAKRFTPVAVALLALILAWQLVTTKEQLAQQAGQLEALRAQLATGQAVNAELLAALQGFATPKENRYVRGAVTITLKPLSTHPWQLLTATGLPEPLGDQVYQIWLDGRVAGSLSFTEAGEAFALVAGPTPRELKLTLVRATASGEAPMVFEYP